MALFQPLGAKVGYDDYIDTVLAGADIPQYIGLNALKNSDVLTAVSIIAGDIARFPIIKKDGDDEIIEDQELDYLLNVKSTGNATARAWKFAMTINAILTGNAYSMILRDPLTGKALQFQFFRPSETVITETDNHELVYTFTDGITGKVYHRKAEDVIHWKFFSHDTIAGRSPLLSLGDEIDLQESGMGTLKKFFRDGFSSGIIKLKGAQLNADSRKKAREDFEKMREGSTGGSPLIFDDTQEYSPLEIDTNVLQLINSNNFSTSQIAKCLRVPAYKLAVNSPNQSIKHLNEDYIKNDLPYYFDAITAEHQLKNFESEERRKYRLVFDTRAITGRDVEEVAKLVDKTLATPNQGRGMLGLSKSDDPNMDRFQSRLDSVYLDKKEEYQDQNKGNTLLKGGAKHEKD